MFGVKVLVGAALIAGSPGLLTAIDLQPNTVEAWESYLHGVDARVRQRADGQKEPFLWTDESADRNSRVRRGEVVVAPMVGDGTRNLPSGLIHDWIGAAFLSGATIESLLSVLHDYDRYKDYYKPVVADSKVLQGTSSDQEFSMVWQHRVLFITAAIQSRYHSHDVTVDAQRGYNVAGTTQVQEIEDYGRAGAHPLAPDTGNGFIWRLHSIVRYEERDGGVYLEVEAIALTRDIPASLRWIVKPVLNHLSINSMTTTLRQTRDAVNASPAAPRQVAIRSANRP